MTSFPAAIADRSVERHSHPVLRTPKSHGPGRRFGSKRWFIVCLCLAAYFGHHTIQGRHGLEARSRLISRASMLAEEIRALEGVRSRLERDVALLNETSPDPDLIEETARTLLGFARPNERILVAAPGQRAGLR